MKRNRPVTNAPFSAKAAKGSATAVLIFLIQIQPIFTFPIHQICPSNGEGQFRFQLDHHEQPHRPHDRKDQSYSPLMSTAPRHWFSNSLPNLRAGSPSVSTALCATVVKGADSSFSNPREGGDGKSMKNTRSPSQVSTSNGKQKQRLLKRSAKKPLSKSKRKNLVKSNYREAKALERRGQWKLACQKYNKILNLDPSDAHSHLGLARLQARREMHASENDNSDARKSFERGTTSCPKSVHLWQAWAVYEESRGNIEKARELFEQALKFDAYNPYVCHAYGLMEKKHRRQQTSLLASTHHQNGNGPHEGENENDNIHIGTSTGIRRHNYEHARSKELWERALQKTSTAALVCSLGELFIQEHDYEKARDLYDKHLPYLRNAKDRTEVYLAMAWMEERYCENYARAHELLQSALSHFPSSSLVHVALARLEGRRRQLQMGNSKIDGKKETARRLANACIHMERQQKKVKMSPGKTENRSKMPYNDGGRVYNAWAHLEVQDQKFDKARKILAQGMERYPDDPMLLQAAGKVEERVGNTTGARDLYSVSLSIEPTAPTLVAYALLELNQPTSKTANYNDYVKGLFEEALLLNPRHGPAYNAYGTAELRHGIAAKARKIFERGVRAKCTDAASIYHGFAKMELSLGNVEPAREILRKGLKEVHLNDAGMDSQHRERAIFLSHTLGMMELNSNRPKEALEVFIDGIERFGNSSQLVLGAAQSNFRLGKHQVARLKFEQSVLMDPEHAQAWQAWGVMEMRAGNVDEARKLFRCGIKNSPKHGALWQAYATMESRLGEVEKGRLLFVSGIKHAPGHVPLYQGWASLELRQDNIVEAKRLLAKALTLDKHNGCGWLIAASIEQRLGNVGLVGLILRRGIECAPSDAELYRALGEQLLRNGDIDNAREVFEKGIEVNPLHAPSYHSLAELEARICNVEGLSKLNRKVSLIFSGNAVEPNPISTAQAWGAKIRAQQISEIPKGVAALADEIVGGDDEATTISEDNLDPFATLASMSLALSKDESTVDLL